MNTPSDQLDRLISRFLDREATASEQRELKAMMRRDPAAAAEFDDAATLDREARYAMRRALGRPLSGRTIPLWARVLRVAGLAAAACVAAFLWLNLPAGGPAPESETSQAGGTLFAPQVVGDDLVERADFERPGREVGESERQWILIPTENPREFLLIEVNHGQRRTIRIQADF